MDEIKNVTFILINALGQILMQLRDGNCDRYPYTWCFPGGTTEVGEAVELALIREVKEEYGLIIKLKDCEFLMTQNLSYGATSEVFACRYTKDKKAVLNEGAAFKWMSLSEIEQLPSLGFEHKESIVPQLEEFLLKQNL